MRTISRAVNQELANMKISSTNKSTLLTKESAVVLTLLGSVLVLTLFLYFSGLTTSIWINPPFINQFKTSTMIKFIIKLKHDKGHIKVSNWAPDRLTAIENVLKSEGAPHTAVVNCKIQKPTIYDIKEATKETAPYFFSRSSMKFFKQRMSDFKVYTANNDKFLISAKSFAGTTQRLFNPYTNELEQI